MGPVVRTVPSRWHNEVSMKACVSLGAVLHRLPFSPPPFVGQAGLSVSEIPPIPLSARPALFHHAGRGRTP